MNIDLDLQDIIEDDVEIIPVLSIDEDEEFNKDEMPTSLPILPLRNNVLFPGVVIPISVGRERSLKAIKKAYRDQKFIGVIAQKDVEIEDPEMEDLYKIGTLARILKMLKMPDGGSTIIIQGVTRFKLSGITQSEPFLQGEISHLDENLEIEKQESREIRYDLRLAVFQTSRENHMISVVGVKSKAA